MIFGKKKEKRKEKKDSLLVVVEAAASGDAVVVLSGEETRSKRAPDGKSVLVVFVKRCVLLLDALAVEHVVLGLVCTWANHTQTLGDAVSLLDLQSGPLRGAPVEAFAVLDDAVEAAHDFLHRHRNVRTVGEDAVDVVETETLQGSIGALDNVLARQTTAVRVLAASAEEDLTGADASFRNAVSDATRLSSARTWLQRMAGQPLPARQRGKRPHSPL